MTAMGRKGGFVLKAGVLAAGLVLGLASGAWAEPCANGATGMIRGVLTETIERVEALITDEGDVHRLATAKEVGELSGGCGTLAFLQGRMKVQPAVSKVPVIGPGVSPEMPDLGKGPISGDLKFFGNGPIVYKATMGGWLDFGPTNSTVTDCNGGPCPFVLAYGTFEIASQGLAGTFQGVALVPFPCPLPTGFCYLNYGGALGGSDQVVPLTIDELQPAPSAKFVITLVAK
jgi:hypothetical protein